MKSFSRTYAGLTSVLIVLCLSVSLLIHTAAFPADDFDVTFDAYPGLDHVCFEITMKNNQEVNDNFPFRFLLNRTSIDIGKAETRLWENEEYEYEVTHCKICELEFRNCTMNNETLEEECYPYRAGVKDCDKCGTWPETKTGSRWTEKTLVSTKKDIGGNELRNQFEEIQIKKSESKRYKLCYYFNEIPRNPETGGWGSYGYMYLESNGKLFYDFEHSSWWNTNYKKRTCWNITNPTGSDITNLTLEIEANMSLFTLSNGCNDFEWGNETASFGYFNWSDCDTTGASNTEWLVRVPLAKSDNKTKACAYYNNSADSTFDSDITKAGILGDDFDDNNISDWGTGGIFTLACTPGGRPLVSNGEIYSNSIDSACMHKALSYNTTANGFRSYVRWFSGSFRGANFEFGTDSGDGYLASLGRDQQQDIEVYRVDDNSGTKIADDDLTIASDTWYKSKSGRKISNNKWSNIYDSTEGDFNNGNTADNTYTEFRNFTVAVRDTGAATSGKIDYILYTVWCDSCSTTKGEEETIGNTTESDGRKAIEAGIKDPDALGPDAVIYPDQHIYLRHADTNQENGTFDVVTIEGNQTWAFNYLTGGSDNPDTGMSNLTTVVYVWEEANMTYGNIEDAVKGLINSTKTS